MHKLYMPGMQLHLIPAAATVSQNIKDLYENSFPLYERRPWQKQELLIKENKLQLIELTAENTFSGFIFYWPLSSCIFIEHFAISISAGSKGVGTMAMEKFARMFGTIVLETEPAEKSEEAFRRVSFYERLGYKKFPFPYKQPPYAEGYPFLEMQLMYNGKETCLTDFEKLKGEIYRKVYQQTDSNQ